MVLFFSLFLVFCAVEVSFSSIYIAYALVFFILFFCDFFFLHSDLNMFILFLGLRFRFLERTIPRSV